jgi:4,5-DOPA dioxygenase extradiol
MPALFIGHGNPMNAVEENSYTQGWRELGRKLPQPEAIVSISAHWLTDGVFVHTAARPRTIHDFYGFPSELYAFSYPAPGSPALAGEILSLVESAEVHTDTAWGLDHGTWVPVSRMWPDATVPVIQLSIDISQPGAFHFRLGQELGRLRDRGVLLIGSGNLVHNLGLALFDQGAGPYDWATGFDGIAADLISRGQERQLINYETLGKAALLSVPTPDHYWPLLYILGMRQQDEPVSFPVEGIAHGSVSMRAVLVG